jgi:shikimate kinase
VLVGAMGSGKTTIGIALAASLGLRFVDNDAQLFARTGVTAADLAAQEGIDALHAAERESVLDALAAPDASVIAAAASTITDSDVRRALQRDAFVVWLRAAPAALAERIAQPASRPFAAEAPARLVARQGRERDPLFEGVADLVVSSDRSTPDVAVTDIVEHLPDALRTNR